MPQPSTKPELQLEIALIAAQIAFQKQAKGLPGTPDFLVDSAKLAIFVHGCYWHQHDCPDGRRAGRVFDVFQQMSRNYRVEKDLSDRRKLHSLGYSTFIAWECDLRRSSSDVASLIRDLLV